MDLGSGWRYRPWCSRANTYVALTVCRARCPELSAQGLRVPQDSSRRCCRPDSASGLGERGKLLRDPLCAAWEAGDGCRSRPTRPTPRQACKPTQRPREAGLEAETCVRARETAAVADRLGAGAESGLGTPVGGPWASGRAGAAWIHAGKGPGKDGVRAGPWGMCATHLDGIQGGPLPEAGGRGGWPGTLDSVPL